MTVHRSRVAKTEICKDTTWGAIVNFAFLLAGQCCPIREVEISVKYSFRAPTEGSIPIALSFKMMSKFALETPAWFSASKAIPLAIEASPITAMCCFSACIFVGKLNAKCSADRS